VLGSWKRRGKNSLLIIEPWRGNVPGDDKNLALDRFTLDLSTSIVVAEAIRQNEHKQRSDNAES
jgi:hypothetical protein